jgi:hypothetical protein
MGLYPITVYICPKCSGRCTKTEALKGTKKAFIYYQCNGKCQDQIAEQAIIEEEVLFWSGGMRIL